jgi:hypothetical protein
MSLIVDAQQGGHVVLGQDEQLDGHLEAEIAAVFLNRDAPVIALLWTRGRRIPDKVEMLGRRRT